MPTFPTKLVAAATALIISACVVSAQTTTPPPAPTAPKAAAPAPKKSVPKKATTPAGIKCSADADAKGLHGKERRKFRSACIREFKKAEKAKKA